MSVKVAVFTTLVATPVGHRRATCQYVGGFQRAPDLAPAYPRSFTRAWHPNRGRYFRHLYALLD